MDPIKQKSEDIIGIRKCLELEEAGLTIVPKLTWDEIANCTQETIICIPGKQLAISPLVPETTRRVITGYVIMD